MPADLWTEAAQMIASGLFVASVAVPVGFVAWVLRPKTEPLLPRWKPWRVPWGGFEVTVAFLMVVFVLPMVMLELLNTAEFYQSVYGDDFPKPKAEGVQPERAAEASTLRVLWASAFSLPLQLGLLWSARVALYSSWKPPARGNLAGRLALAVAAWLIITPAVMLVHASVNLVYLQLNWQPDTHSLAKLGGRPLLDQVLLVVEACVAAPLREEIIFRGILLPWCIGRMRLRGAGVSPITSARPWFVMVAAGAFAVMSAKPGAMIFVGAMALGLVVVWKFARTGARRARGIYASAAFFAAVHSGVWPSPIPLFLLGLGLGYLAVRTRGVLVPVVVHGLFNAVSVVFVLRGAA